MYTVVVHDPNAKALFSYGPYGTPAQAQKAVAGLVSSGPLPNVAYTHKLRGVLE